MCYNCGCFNPKDDMGHADNITDSTLQKLAGDEELNSFKKRLLDQLSENKVDQKIEAEIEKAAKAWGQSVEEAKRNTKDLLKSEVK